MAHCGRAWGRKNCRCLLSSIVAVLRNRKDRLRMAASTACCVRGFQTVASGWPGDDAVKYLKWVAKEKDGTGWWERRPRFSPADVSEKKIEIAYAPSLKEEKYAWTSLPHRLFFGCPRYAWAIEKERCAVRVGDRKEKRRAANGGREEPLWWWWWE